MKNNMFYHKDRL